jgi:hypothetical protein
MVIAAHPTKSDVAFVLPLQGGEFRCPPEGKLRVYRTSNAGKTWEPLTRGLPQQDAYMGTYREAMTTDNFDASGIYFWHQHGPALRQRRRGRDLAPHNRGAAADLLHQRRRARQGACVCPTFRRWLTLARDGKRFDKSYRTRTALRLG